MSWPVNNTSHGNSRSSIFETFHTPSLNDEEFDMSMELHAARPAHRDDLYSADVIDVDDDLQFVDSPVEEEQEENIATLFMSCSPGRDTEEEEEEEEDEDDSVPLSMFYGFGRAKTTKPRRGGATNAGTGSRKKPAQKKAKKDPNAPKKPMRAYSLFFSDTQASIRAQNQQASFGEMSRIVATMWESLEPHEKAKYISQAAKDQQVYLKALAAYEAEKKSGSRPKQKKAKPAATKAKAVKVLSDDDDDDSDDFVPMTTTSRSSAARQKPPSPVISSDSCSESADSISDSDSKSSAENNNEVVPRCSRTECKNLAVDDPRWDFDYCSVDCVVLHCRDVFNAWVAARQSAKVE